MKIEKIDDNSIRCTLTSLDLSSRNINLRDMTYGSPAAKSLFSEMMQRAQAEVGFTPDNTPLMIEAVPLQGGSVQLIITKVDDPEELDTRFSKFTQEAFKPDGLFSQLASEILEGAQGIIKQAKDKAQTDGKNQIKPVTVMPGDTSLTRIYRFTNLDRTIQASRAVRSVFIGESKVYKDNSSKKYYLVLHTAQPDVDALSRSSNILSEYGTKIGSEDLNEAYYREHYEVLVESDAIEKLSKI